MDSPRKLTTRPATYRSPRSANGHWRSDRCCCASFRPPRHEPPGVRRGSDHVDSASSMARVIGPMPPGMGATQLAHVSHILDHDRQLAPASVRVMPTSEHDRAWFDHLSDDQPRPSSRRDHNIRLL